MRDIPATNCVIPIGLLAVVGFAMVVTIFRKLFDGGGSLG